MTMSVVGTDKIIELILRHYWFPHLRQEVKSYIANCLKCITYSPVSGKREGLLNCIPKGDLPFENLHIDHYGPLENSGQLKYKYIFVVIDAFTKFIRLCPCKTTNTNKAIRLLKDYFRVYSRPKRLISGRGSSFTFKHFRESIESIDIKLILIATGAPRGNGQVKRINRVITPMLSKLAIRTNLWESVLAEVEFVLNNTTSRSTGDCASRLLYGMLQTGKTNDNVKLVLEKYSELDKADFTEIMGKASEKIEKIENYNMLKYDKKHKCANKYKEGDYVVILNTHSTPNTNKKLIPKYRGPYEIKKILPNDRYVVQNIVLFQDTQTSYEGVLDMSRIKP